MFAEIESLIGRINDDRLAAGPFVVEKLKQPPDALVHRLDAPQVIVHVALVLPAHEVFALQPRGTEGGVTRFVVGIPGPAILGRQVFRRCQLEVDRGHRLGDRHVLVVFRLAAPGIIVEQRRRLGIAAIVVVAQVADRRQPLAVGGLVLAHEQKWFGLVAVLQPVERKLGDDVGGITLMLHPPAVVDHGGVVVHPLPRQDLPLVEAGRVGDQVPLAKDGRLVTGRTEQFGEGRLRTVEATVGIVVETIQVGVLTRQDRRATRPADRVRDDAPVETHPLPGQAIDVRGVDQPARVVIGTDGLVGMVVAENEDDVRRFSRLPDP